MTKRERRYHQWIKVVKTADPDWLQSFLEDAADVSAPVPTIRGKKLNAAEVQEQKTVGQISTGPGQLEVLPEEKLSHY